MNLTSLSATAGAPTKSVPSILGYEGTLDASTPVLAISKRVKVNDGVLGMFPKYERVFADLTPTGIDGRGAFTGAFDTRAEARARAIDAARALGSTNPQGIVGVIQAADGAYSLYTSTLPDDFTFADARSSLNAPMWTETSRRPYGTDAVYASGGEELWHLYDGDTGTSGRGPII